MIAILKANKMIGKVIVNFRNRLKQCLRNGSTHFTRALYKKLNGTILFLY